MRTFLMLTLCLNLLPLMGCSGKSSSEPTNAEVPGTHPEHHHPEKGIEGGTLIELGEEEYHVELLIDNKAGQVKINVLDGAATKRVPVEKTLNISFNAKKSGETLSFPLTAQPHAEDPEGKTSSFGSEEKALSEFLSSRVQGVKLVGLKIQGKAYSGTYSRNLIELGEAEYFVELNIDHAGEVAITIFDADVTQRVAVEKSQTVTFSGRQSGKDVSYPLTAKPEADDPQGKSSRFISTDKALGKYLGGHVHDVKLNLAIEGKPYTGNYDSH